MIVVLFPLVHDMITARMTELEECPFRTWADVERYLHGCAALEELVCYSMAQNDEAIVRAARTAGRVTSAHQFLKTMLKRVARGHTILPQADFSGIPRPKTLGGLVERWRLLSSVCARSAIRGRRRPGLTTGLPGTIWLFFGVIIAERTLSILTAMAEC